MSQMSLASHYIFRAHKNQSHENFKDREKIPIHLKELTSDRLVPFPANILCNPMYCCSNAIYMSNGLCLQKIDARLFQNLLKRKSMIG
ncbi:hypothetical protein AQUCO_03100023v1 [Aquilegia coerulea]|uniref:Uncharacterized protein n=1 Tax=Aquilegia coerulea TaxID=218851 RepID=A0A2G5D0E4_AQUCA|nr:hypothetical protein AQUCO_03100023v1 [Aquilegia coerulea]